jgi:hypothetical protein
MILFCVDQFAIIAMPVPARFTSYSRRCAFERVLHFGDNYFEIERPRQRIMQRQGMIRFVLQVTARNIRVGPNPDCFVELLEFSMLNKSLILALASAGLLAFGAAQAQNAASGAAPETAPAAAAPEAAPAAAPAAKKAHHKAAKKHHKKHAKKAAAEASEPAANP